MWLDTIDSQPMQKDIKSTVISTRIRIARNIEGYNFPSKLSRMKAKEIITKVDRAAAAMSSKRFKLYHMEELSEGVIQSLCDEHLISKHLLQNRECSAALIDENTQQNISIMINEEDHLRQQYISSGLALFKGYKELNKIDNALAKTLCFAFDEDLGYLTACPTNIGTGLRASVMLFLPGLTKQNRMAEIMHTVQVKGHTVRGVFGEGSSFEGNMYQVSNEVTLGESEESILNEVHNTILTIVNAETEARKILLAREQLELKDACRRAYGILLYSVKIGYEEFLQLISLIKLGIAFSFFSEFDFESFTTLNRLIAQVRPASINLAFDREMSEEEQDIYRAERCKQELLVKKG